MMHFKNRYLCEGVDIGIYLLYTHRGMVLILSCLDYSTVHVVVPFGCGLSRTKSPRPVSTNKCCVFVCKLSTSQGYIACPHLDYYAPVP